jgi:hypothetical protein
MKNNNYLITKIIVFWIVILFCLTSSSSMSFAQNTTKESDKNPTINQGQILFAPMNSWTTYLIDSNGLVRHTWPSTYFPGESAYLLEDGSLLRTMKLSFVYGGDGGGIQKIDWDGSVIWEYRYYTSDYLSHHDICPLPNGNVLLIAWEIKTIEEAIAAGRDPNKLTGNKLMPVHIIEVKPTGPTSGDIVWEWHAWDHLIQDFDPSKANYGVVADHPELIDINYGFTTADWLHTNSIDYNKKFDQILLSVRNFNQIWIIDHSTTTEEAAGHIGGNSGKGGDLLYRWGNPQTYDAGNDNDQKYFLQHDASWIKPGCPGEGDILVFNNGIDRPGGSYTSVDEIVPPVDDEGNYYLEPGMAFGPSEPIWTYDCSFFSLLYGGAIRLPNGNTLICNGPEGRFFEVTPEGNTIWEYINEYPTPATNSVFKIQYISPEEPPEPEVPDLHCEGSLSWTRVKPGTMVTGSFQVENIGGSDSFLRWNINMSGFEWGTWSFVPSSGENLTPEDGKVTIQVTVQVPTEENTEFEGYIYVENVDDPTDVDVVPVSLRTQTVFSFTIAQNLFVKLKSIPNGRLWTIKMFSLS